MEFPRSASADDSSQVSGNDPWETAYTRFETPDQEIRKFTRRLIRLGAYQWSREAEILELCCGRGNGLHALSKLGFTRLAGIDLSDSLVAQYKGPAKLCVCDCRRLPFADSSKDIVIVQGGLHHLATLPEDLEQTLSETHRVLSNNGLFAVVEPWLTPFLVLVHTACHRQFVRYAIPKIDALATMIDRERPTYYQWLAQPKTIVRLFEHFFSTTLCKVKWGKFIFVGRKKLRID